MLLLWIIAFESWRRRRRRAALQWTESQRQAQWAERLIAEKTALVAELSHEIRNPLNGVLGMSRLLSEQPLPSSAQRYLGVLIEAGKQMTRLLDDMLDWSRLEARPAALPRQAKHGCALPASGVGIGPLCARGRPPKVAFCFPRCTSILPGLVAMADPARLLQIVENLLSNAIKFTRTGGICIRATADNAVVQLRIHDSGPGLSAADIERLFRPFSNAWGSARSAGTGLGLAISRSLAARMAGSLSVESKPGAGLCFILALGQAPAAVDPEPAAELLLFVGDAAAGGPQAVAGRRRCARPRSAGR